MKSARRGTRTSAVEVTNISPTGFWLLFDARELFVPFASFPWFRDATIEQLFRVQRPSVHHLRWPDLDVDLAVESIEHPDRYPLVSGGSPKPMQRSAATARVRDAGATKTRAVRRVGRGKK